MLPSRICASLISVPTVVVMQDRQQQQSSPCQACGAGCNKARDIPELGSTNNAGHQHQLKTAFKQIVPQACLIKLFHSRSNAMQPARDPSSTSHLLMGHESSNDISTRVPDEEIQNIVRCIESRTRGFLAALNTHDFDPSSPPWQYKSPEFRHEGGYLSPNDLDLQGYLGLWRHIMTANPEMFCRITDLTTYVDREAGYAEVFCNMETTGRPKGIIRTSVAILEFRCEKRRKRDAGEWLCFRFRGARGVDGAATAVGE
ncbi:hypothetical protein M409DRAFT_54567 [Zasmidium cellare ATCC 36951]|uniref:Uncharacterized protein n=1 Tax=Zasmidium cellare ATCC 36951 TaxID=1080233 RepID=A0A6A6CM17_ZASCE|nr:uncharacterized protein M409DRAFT_54567 [Zasmidium cellare ATCC 36951]KAF2166779.1 hypothetical protein M409DRAFT_54567 [Zasmidium cellare ATCC 36951]